MNELINVLEKVENFSPAVTEDVVKSWIGENEYNTGEVMNAFRLVIVGALRGPHIFDIIGWIGKEESIKRINAGVSAITGQ